MYGTRGTFCLSNLGYCMVKKVRIHFTSGVQWFSVTKMDAYFFYHTVGNLGLYRKTFKNIWRNTNPNWPHVWLIIRISAKEINLFTQIYHRCSRRRLHRSFVLTNIMSAGDGKTEEVVCRLNVDKNIRCMLCSAEGSPRCTLDVFRIKCIRNGMR